MATKPVRKDDKDPDDDEPTTAKPAQVDDDGDGTDWKAEARKWERRAKESHREAQENSTAAQRLEELENADKSEAEKANARAVAAEAKAKAAERRALAAEVAAEKGLSMSVARRLVGETREELETDADELLESFGSKGEGGKVNDKGEGAGAATGTKSDAKRMPKEDLRPGASNDDDETADLTSAEADKIADGILAGRRI